MPRRTREVWPYRQLIAHWAAEHIELGRCPTKGGGRATVSVRQNVLYSYAQAIGVRHVIGGSTIFIITSQHFSITTSKHTSRAYGAAHRNVLNDSYIFRCASPVDFAGCIDPAVLFKKVVEELETDIRAGVRKEARARENKPWRAANLLKLNESYAKLCEVCAQPPVDILARARQDLVDGQRAAEEACKMRRRAYGRARRLAFTLAKKTAAVHYVVPRTLVVLRRSGQQAQE